MWNPFEQRWPGVLQNELGSGVRVIEEALIQPLKFYLFFRSTLSTYQFDVVPFEITPDDFPLILDYAPLAIHEVVDRESLFDVVVDTVEATLSKAGEIQDSFAQCFLIICQSSFDSLIANLR